jgi:hypothetical protein
MSAEHDRQASVPGETGESEGIKSATGVRREGLFPSPQTPAIGTPLRSHSLGSQLVPETYPLEGPCQARGPVTVTLRSADPADFAQWEDQADDEVDGEATSCQKGSGCNLQCAVRVILLKRLGSDPAGHMVGMVFETDFSDGSLTDYIEPAWLDTGSCPSPACLFLLSRLRPSTGAAPSGSAAREIGL